MSAVFAILLAVGSASTDQPSSEWFDFVQGRATDVIAVSRVVRRCGFRTVNVNIMRGPAFYHKPEDQGGALELRKAEETPAVGRCLQQKVRVFRKRYPDLEFYPGVK